MTSDAGEVLRRFNEPEGNRSVVLEDDGRVAYAYLLEGDSVAGDVWLYNVGQDPDAVDWRDRSALPFLNPARYCTGERVPRLRAGSNIDCKWSDQGVTVSIDGVVWAHLQRGAKPGWSRAARVDGPLAKVLR